MKQSVLALTSKVLGFLPFASCAALPPQQPDLTPPKQFLTPYFKLQVISSPNSTLIGAYLTSPAYQSELSLNLDPSLAATWYQSGPDYTSSQHPQIGNGSPVLVRNVSNAVPDNIAGTPYTPRNLIVGTSGCLTCDESALPRAAALFDKSQEQWDSFGGWQTDFSIEGPPITFPPFLQGVAKGNGTNSDWVPPPPSQLPLWPVKFNVSEGGALSGWDKTSFCTFNDGVEERYIVVVTDRYYPEDGCSEIHLGWSFVGF